MDELKNYIKQELKKKQKPKEIINALVSNGHDEKSIKFKVYKIIFLRYFFYILFSLIFILIILLTYYRFSIEEYSFGDLYTTNVSEWIISEENHSSIDISSITKGNSYTQGKSQYYLIPDLGSTTVFELNGYYKGNYIYNVYNDGEKDVMKISKSMIPNDGVIEGFIVERINDYKINNISAFIFVDSDWKNAIPNTKIFFGTRYQYYIDFKFNEVSPGIYMTEIFDDPNRHSEGFSISYGGIAVGDLTPDDIVNNNIINKTFMRLYS